MNIIYLDESGNTGTNMCDISQPIFVLAGMIVDVYKWQNLEKKLQDDIKTFFPDIPEGLEIHTTDLRNGGGYFRSKEISHRLNFCKSWLKHAQEADCLVFYRAIEKKKFLSWTTKEYGSGIKINPHIIAFALLSNVINDHLKSHDKLGMFVMDENKEISKDVERSIKLLRGLESTIKLSQIIEKGFFIESSHSLPLQLCDLCAYYIRKYEEHEIAVPVKESDLDIADNVFKIVSKRTESFNDIIEWIDQQQKKSGQGKNP